MKRFLLVVFCLIFFSESGLAQAENFDGGLKQLAVTPLSLSRECAGWLTTQGTPYGTIVIDDQKRLDELLKLMPKFTEECKRYKFPEVDFSRSTFIGVRIVLGNCPTGKSRSVRVFQDDKEKLYRIYSQGDLGGCRGTSSVTVWLLAPKLPEGYKIVFRTGTIN